MDINEIKGRRERKDPLKTFIGGLVIGIIIGGAIVSWAVAHMMHL